MNNLYQWHDERMVDWEMKEINRELRQASLLREAGIPGINWLARAGHALRSFLRARPKNPGDYSATEHRSP